MNVMKYFRFMIAGIFLLSGIGKLFDVIGFQYLIATYGFPTFQILAPFIVIGEIVLGVLLLLDIKPKKTAILMVLLVLLFTGVYTYGYLKLGIRDCGCFGPLGLHLHPIAVYVRNLTLVALGIYMYINGGEGVSWDDVPLFKRIIAWTIILPTIFISGMTSRLLIAKPQPHSFENKALKETDLNRFINVTHGRVLVSFMSYSCSHCLNSVENYVSYYQKGWVDTSFCYMMTGSMAVQDTLRHYWHEAFAGLSCQEIKDSIGFIEVLPTTFFIEDDTIRDVITGELPSPIVLFRNDINR
ncbi:MAG: DoxX family protein [Muribaculum sp.]|nr:DoxX family protein [Muribaculum sp.]